jgi:hypothetical protein
MTVLKGYFGEVLAFMLAESYAPCRLSDWEVPCFLFRFHMVAFQQLELASMGGAIAAAFPGRTGDDALAFRRDSRGRILAVLCCEAKCTSDHDSSQIAEAHQKVSQPGPVDILQLIEVLQDSSDPASSNWIIALRHFREQLITGQFERKNLVCYVCGRRPVRSPTWIPKTSPHAAYTSRHQSLEAIEVHLENVDATIAAVYSPEGWL